MQKPGTRAVLVTAALAALPSFAAAAITVQTTTNATTMVNNLVPAGSGIAVVDGSATYTGAAGASGTFTGANFLGTGFTSGVVLTTGMANNLDGPNVGPSDFSDDNDFDEGNPRLDAIVSPQTTNNASTLTFQFVSLSSSDASAMTGQRNNRCAASMSHKITPALSASRVLASLPQRRKLDASALDR